MSDLQTSRKLQELTSSRSAPSNLDQQMLPIQLTERATNKSGVESATETDLFIVEKWRIDGEVLALLIVDANRSVDLPKTRAAA
ncbi:hypothetical protein FAVG1_01395 [Fusarium avenaceum]|nr:hypothetical protein FAVG1_01395 [Fusarium avenaceum]